VFLYSSPFPTISELFVAGYSWVNCYMTILCEFWTSDEFFDVAIEISGIPTVRFQILHEKNAMLLFKKEFETLEQLRSFHNDFVMEGGKSRCSLLNIPATEYLLSRYPCGLMAGDVIELKSGFTQNEEHMKYNFLKRVGWRFTVITGDKHYPNVVWLQTHKEGSQQKYFPIFEKYIPRFCVIKGS
jgi:hypothetical protein